MYDNGGRIGPRHFPVMVEPGETIIPKTQNMLSGSGGITLNIQGDIVTNDADEFAERVAVALPEALRKVNVPIYLEFWPKCSQITMAAKVCPSFIVFTTRLPTSCSSWT